MGIGAVLGILFAVALLGEKLSGTQVAGIVLILSSVFCCTDTPHQ